MERKSEQAEGLGMRCVGLGWVTCEGKSAASENERERASAELCEGGGGIGATSSGTFVFVVSEEEVGEYNVLRRRVGPYRWVRTRLYGGAQVMSQEDSQQGDVGCLSVCLSVCVCPVIFAIATFLHAEGREREGSYCDFCKRKNHRFFFLVLLSFSFSFPDFWWCLLFYYSFFFLASRKCRFLKFNCSLNVVLIIL